jgi:Rrf2 family protein
MEIPEQFLSKIAQQLGRAGIIEIIQGAKGGYRLLPEPEDLSLLQVVEAVIGEIVLNDCIIHPETCQRSPSCSVHKVWEKARSQLRDTLGRTRYSELVGPDSCTADLMAEAPAGRRAPAAS